jgi:hypothetical protein
MKNLFFFMALLMSANCVFAQNPAYHWEINGMPVPGATSVTFVCTEAPPYDRVHDSVFYYSQIVAAGKMLHKYKGIHITGNVLQASGCTLALGNLIEMNRTMNPKSNYTTMYCVAGGLAFAGYVLNEWVAPGFIAKAGLCLQGNGVGIDLDKR